MDRFIIENIDGSVGWIYCKEEISHITKTLRMTEGDKLEVTDGKGKAFIGEIDSISKQEIKILLLDEIASRELHTNIIVYQGIPKAQKMDLIVQKITEIGVFKIVPVKFERCIRILGEKEEKQIQRWQRIAEEAVKQSKRSRVPDIVKAISINDFEKEVRENDITFLCYENESTEMLKNLLHEIKSDREIKKIGIIVGPEGGITEKEQHQLCSYGAYSVSIGSMILRTETAAIVTSGIIAYELG
ncbi:MAG: RsmE family RNA methyltransferase [Peptostreptococcaceae bacterium]|nr:RsmE family RNA methyltransferase [Peptostreptococcaceae bacterium]